MDQARPIIIKRRGGKGGGDAHHGGAWKVAYADFVTAMMAFFLLMWLLNATSEDQRRGLADYFDPSIPISRTSAGGAGMLGGDTVFVEPDAAGTRKEGVRPRLSHSENGVDAGESEASADLPETETGARQAAIGSPSGQAGGAEDGGLEDLADDLAGRIQDGAEEGLIEHFSMRMTPEGLVIEIVDIEDKPLFASGAARPEPILKELIDILVPVLERATNDIAVVGHTDAAPFNTRRGYSNWELSADRANAARRLLADSGLDAERIVRVTGRAATDPIASDPFAPKNRRIAVTLLRRDPGN